MYPGLLEAAFGGAFPMRDALLHRAQVVREAAVVVVMQAAEPGWNEVQKEWMEMEDYGKNLAQ